MATNTTTCVQAADYYHILYIIKEYCSLYNNEFYSVFAYGSTCRFEATPGASDIDLMVIIKDQYISEHVYLLLKKLYDDILNKFKVQLHIRVRNISDLYTHYSGNFDCGFTNSINKVRDSITLSSICIDNEYITLIKSSSEKDIRTNIENRLSDLRYRVRSSIYKNVNNYNIGVLLCNLSEIFCYANATQFVNTKDACFKANQLYDSHYLYYAPEYKKGMEIDYGKAISFMDSFIDICYKTNSNTNHEPLKNVMIEDIASNIHSMPSIQSFLLKSGMSYKTSRIQSNCLIISRITSNE